MNSDKKIKDRIRLLTGESRQKMLNNALDLRVRFSRYNNKPVLYFENEIHPFLITKFIDATIVTNSAVECYELMKKQS